MTACAICRAPTDAPGNLPLCPDCAEREPRRPMPRPMAVAAPPRHRPPEPEPEPLGTDLSRATALHLRRGMWR